MPGVLITRFLPYGPLAVVLDLVVCLLVIQALRSAVVPAISAGMLPLALGLTGTAWLLLVVGLAQRLSRRRHQPEWGL